MTDEQTRALAHALVRSMALLCDDKGEQIVVLGTALSTIVGTAPPALRPRLIGVVKECLDKADAAVTKIQTGSH